MRKFDELFQKKIKIYEAQATSTLVGTNPMVKPAPQTNTVNPVAPKASTTATQPQQAAQQAQPASVPTQPTPIDLTTLPDTLVQLQKLVTSNPQAQKIMNDFMTKQGQGQPQSPAAPAIPQQKT